MIPSGVGGHGGQLFGMVPNLPATTASILLQNQSMAMSQLNLIKHEPMDVSPSATTTARITADLYLCDSGSSNRRERPAVESNASIDLLEKEHKRLTQTKIKDTLSSFVPDIPGEFDSSNNPESMLRTLIDRPPIGGREFLPLSDQSLLGFRLHPGSLPEQYRLDPLSLTEPPKHHKKSKKKHKHKHVDKSEESSLSNYSPSISREQSPPGDPCDFIKPENTPNFFPPLHQPRPQIHHLPPPTQQPSPQPHIIQSTSIGSHSPATAAAIIQTGGGGNSNPFLNISPRQSVIVRGGNEIPFTHMQAYPMQGPGASSILAGAGSTAGLKIPPKPKKKRHNLEGPEGAIPRKKKKKDKDKEKNKEKKKRKHHNPDGTPIPSLAPATVPASSTVVSPLASLTSLPPTFGTIHPTTQQ